MVILYGVEMPDSSKFSEVCAHQDVGRLPIASSFTLQTAHSRWLDTRTDSPTSINSDKAG
ncbi:hypothetical protein Cylst_0554 [Cylindrospermum stagnale PCC 7417]|uniref:Uncharacterized protein n=2 Tax=Cylindrospermum stagnale TaxID=142864 RepID=K9WSY0_9NOST|nr:hypothetical protein Cylst_0554 [Cylindrospermum stagnale PCC 7417]